MSYSIASSKEDLQQIVDLQKKNVPENLNDKKKIKEGFVRVKQTLEILTKMSSVCQNTQSLKVTVKLLVRHYL